MQEVDAVADVLNRRVDLVRDAGRELSHRFQLVRQAQLHRHALAFFHLVHETLLQSASVGLFCESHGDVRANAHVMADHTTRVAHGPERNADRECRSILATRAQLHLDRESGTDGLIDLFKLTRTVFGGQQECRALAEQLGRLVAVRGTHRAIGIDDRPARLLHVEDHDVRFRGIECAVPQRELVSQTISLRAQRVPFALEMREGGE